MFYAYSSTGIWLLDFFVVDSVFFVQGCVKTYFCHAVLCPFQFDICIFGE